MRPKNLILLPMGLAIVAACDSPTGPGPSPERRNAVLTSTTQDIVIIMENPCVTPAESVLMSGKIHITDTEQFDGSGGTHETLTVAFVGLKGTEPISGATYTGMNEASESFNMGGNNDSFETTETFTERVIRHTSLKDDSFLYHINVHLTRNAQGVPTADVENTHMDCTG